MQDLQILNQVYTLFNTICYIPYMLYWISGFVFNMYWLSCMFTIVYKSNIYHNLRDKKYFNCINIVCIELYYLYGVLSWNPLIISILTFHSIIIGNLTYKFIYDLFRECYELDLIMKKNTVGSEPVDDELVTAEPDDNELVVEQADSSVTAEPVTAEPVTAEPVTAEPVTAEHVAEQEEENSTPPIIISVTEEQHVVEQ